jgi:hypothetical protein
MVKGSALARIQPKCIYPKGVKVFGNQLLGNPQKGDKDTCT